MFLDSGGDGSFFGDVAWWVFPLVGIPMMLVMMGGMMFMMRMMMGMGGMGSQGSGDAPTSDQESEAEVASLRREVADLRRGLAAREPESAGRGHGDDTTGAESSQGTDIRPP